MFPLDTILSRVAAVTLLVALCACGSAPPVETHAKSAASDFGSLVENHVAHPERDEAATAIAQRMAAQIDDLFAEISAAQGRLFDLNADYDATRAQFDAEFAELDVIRDRSANRLIELVLELRTHITAEEWAEIHVGMAPYRKP